MCVCVYLIVEDDHDKHTEQHWLHQEDDVVSTERVDVRTKIRLSEYDKKWIRQKQLAEL